LQTEGKKEEKGFPPESKCSRGDLLFNTLKKKKDFEKLRKEGRVFKNKYLIIFILPGKERHQIRSGLGVGKKIGKACKRNKIRRVLKDILRKVLIPFGIDIYIIARNTITEAGYGELKEEIERSLNKFFLPS